MKVYRALAYLVAVEVIVQAATHAYGAAGLGHWIWADHHTATRAVLEDGDYTGRAAGLLHGQNGAMIVPLIALALLVVAVIVRRRLVGAVRWAGISLCLVVLQVVLGFVTLEVPAVGALHAVNAFVLLWAAVHTARLPAPPARSPASDGERSRALPTHPT
jgi:heme A synthase